LTAGGRGKHVGGKMMGMVKRLAFVACCGVAILATMFAGVGVVQLEAIVDGAYDPVRDDGWPPDFMLNYYARWKRMMIGTMSIAAAASFTAWCLRPIRKT